MGLRSAQVCDADQAGSGSRHLPWVDVLPQSPQGLASLDFAAVTPVSRIWARCLGGLHHAVAECERQRYRRPLAQVWPQLDRHATSRPSDSAQDPVFRCRRDA